MQLSRRNFLKSVGIGTAVSVLEGCGIEPFTSEQSRRPNIIYILADDLGYGDVSCYGQDKFLTPHIDSLASGGVRVNFDPANLVMVTGDDPVGGVLTLGDYIVYTHAKDGIMLSFDRERVYNFFAEGGIEDLRLEEYFLEKPLGEGDVDFDSYIEALDAVGYTGYLTIERETGDDPAEDIRKAVVFLQRYLKEV